MSDVTLKLSAADELQKLQGEMQATPAAWATDIDGLAHVRRHCQTLLFLAETYSQVKTQLPRDLHQAGKVEEKLTWLAEQCEDATEKSKALLGRTAEDFISAPKYYYSELRLRRRCLLPARDQVYGRPEFLSFLATEVVAFLRMEERFKLLMHTTGPPENAPEYWETCGRLAHQSAVELTAAMMSSFEMRQVVRELQEVLKEERRVCNELLDGTTGRVRFASSTSFREEEFEEEDDEDDGDGDYCSVIAKPVFVVSDCTGESAERTVRCALGQFGHCFERNCQAEITTFRFATSSMMEDIACQAKQRGAFVLFTLVDPVANVLLEKYCEEYSVKCHDLWSPLLEKLEGYFDASRLGVPGRRQFADENYMKLVECIEYTRLFDDGVHPHRWAEADIMIIGPSRSGKTPLSFFMAQRGYKVANYPLVVGETPPEELWTFPKDCVFALNIDAKKLASIRSARMKSLNMSSHSNYAKQSAIREELEWCKKLYRSNPRWKVLDTTDTGIEENCATILKHLDRVGLAGRAGNADNPSAI